MFPNNWTTREKLALKYFRINYKPKLDLVSRVLGMRIYPLGMLRDLGAC